MYCKYCGKPLEKDAQFCVHCGKSAAEMESELPQKTEPKHVRPNGISRKQIIIGVIAGLVLTTLCSPLVLFGRSEVLNSLLNPENRTVAVSSPAGFDQGQVTESTPSTAGSDSIPIQAPSLTSDTPSIPDIPMVFASDRDDPNFTECSQTGSCWTQIFYTPAFQSGDPINLTLPLGFGSAANPVLSPDGTRVAFEGFMPGGQANHIYVVNIDGSGLKRVSQDSYTHMYPSWSPNSSHLVYMSRPDTGTFYNLNIVDIFSLQIRQLSIGDYMDRFPSWSPDGEYVAFHTNREDPNPATCWPNCLLAIYIIDAETSEGGPAQDDGNLIDGGAVDWSPNSRQLAFHSNRDGNWNIYLMQQDGSVRQLTNEPGDELFPSWSPDGNFISYGRETADGFQIAVTPVDHFEPVYFESQANRDIQPDW